MGGGAGASLEIGKMDVVCAWDWKRSGLRVGVVVELSSSMSTRGGGFLKEESGMRLI